MAATLLQIVNKVRALLREEPLASIAANDIQTAALVEIVNGAMRRILDDHDWSFLVREDGILAFPEAITGVNVTVTAMAPTPIPNPDVTVEAAIDTDYGLLLRADTHCYRFQVRGAAANPDHGNESHRVLSYGANVLTLDQYRGLVGSFIGTADWLLYTHEAALPDTVSRVLSVRDEEQRDYLIFQHQMLDIDRMFPSPIEATGNPYFAVFGGTIRNTGTSGVETAGTHGVRLAIYPPYTESFAIATLTRVRYRRIYYRYSYRFANLSAATDSLRGVPDEISELIVRRAFIDCLMSNVQMDPQRGVPMYLHLERDLQLAQARDIRDPLRRMVPRPFGHGLQRNTRRRWASQQVPNP